ncbi:LysR family transcriptional regulator [Mesorhizobium sp. CU2]|uniref:LysR family transcriptional regulator n=1 Tax=unclassified Mesorhizobium TaxID=325217 RepID=UPI00112EE70C|nr:MULTISPECIES: LysR family transcriptional regulator [unclassified Mesorhizobium]TPN89420.1 LysR family transcriptional regulator [Mesorhizobium sp. CU3]TPO22216.1 LysR family transcriptional regulator [Mesorhizobium sp. CU2]
MRNLPHLSYLEAFEASARHLSFTRAAEELKCTQAAISQRVRALEQFFARPLFHRLRNGLELTEVGTAYLPGISEALDRAEAATQGLMGARAQTSLTVSAPLSFTTLWLARHLGSFSAAHPEIEIRLNSTIWTDPNVELADLSILVLDPSQQMPAAVRLGQERLTLLCDPATAGKAGAKPDSHWFNAARLIHVQGRVQLLDQWAKSRKIAIAPKLAPIKADNAAAALELAACSGGIAATLSTYAAAYLQSGRLVAPFGLGDALAIALHIVPNPQRRPSRSAALFIAWLSQAFSSSQET